MSLTTLGVLMLLGVCALVFAHRITIAICDTRIAIAKHRYARCERCDMRAEIERVDKMMADDR